jgi:hypothetical protein
MKEKAFRFNFTDLGLRTDQIEKVLGYQEGESHESFAETISGLLKEAEKICDLRCEYRIYDEISLEETGRILKIDGASFNIGKIIYGQIKKSTSIAVFCCTAGEEIGARGRKLIREGDFLDGYIYDIIGSEAVEAVADLMQSELEKEMALSGRRITNRFSPGYCGWYVLEQHQLFRLMPGNFCGIKLTDSALMEPIKSVSGIIGIGENVKHLPYTCTLCDMENCIYRRKTEN